MCVSSLWCVSLSCVCLGIFVVTRLGAWLGTWLGGTFEINCIARRHFLNCNRTEGSFILKESP